MQSDKGFIAALIGVVVIVLLYLAWWGFVVWTIYTLVKHFTG